MTDSLVIAGAGHAAGQLVASLKQCGFGGKIMLLGEEPYLPYQRPPLSKKYLAGQLDAERLHFKPASFYDDPGIDVRLGVRVERIDRESRTVTTHDGDLFAYGTLVLALGSRPRRIPVDGESLAGVCYLRSIDDVDRIRTQLEPGRKLVIVGAGYIGLEVAAVCRQLGLDVTVVEMAGRVMSRVVSPEVSQYYQQCHERHGVRILLSTGLRSLHGNGHVRAVETDTGDLLDADLVIIGAGIVPNSELAADAGLDVDNGIVVDDRCRSSDPGIYAIGDCTLHPNGIYDRYVRLESVHNALEQAKTAAHNICGHDVRYEQVPWFWSDQYDIKLQIAGLSQGYDQAVLRGNPDDGRFSCSYLQDGVLIAIDAINSPKDFVQAKTLIADHARIDAAKLADTASELKNLA